MAEYRTLSGLSQRHRRAWLPPPVGWVLFIIFSLVLMSVLNFNALSHQIWQQQFSSKDFAPVTDRFIHFQDKLAMPAVMLFWVGVGIATYTVIWLAENIFSIAKNQAEESKYLTAGAVPLKDYWRTRLESNGFLLAAIVSWIFLIAIYLRYLLSGFSQLFHQALQGGALFHRIEDGVAAVAGNTLAIYVFWLSSRVLAAAWRANRSS